MILSKEYYYQEMDRLLNDQTTYEKLKGDPSVRLKVELTNWFSEGLQKTILNQKEADYIIPYAPKIPVMYIVPKVHKIKKLLQEDLLLVELTPFFLGLENILMDLSSH